MEYPDELKKIYEARNKNFQYYEDNLRQGNIDVARSYREYAESFEDEILRRSRTPRYSPLKYIPIGQSLPWKETMAEETKQQKFKMRDVTVAEMKYILNNTLKTHIVPFIWGPPGVGKSSVVKEIVKEKGWKIIDLRLSLLNPVDLRGLPTIDHAAKQANWLPPSFLPHENTTEEGLLFLDEINLAPLSVQAAAYQLILDKQIGEYRFPKTWKIVAAGNREVDKANVFKISAPLANRFIHFTVRPDFYAWKEWAVGAGINSTLIHFLSLRPPAIYEPPADGQKAFPSPRSWEFVSKLLDIFQYDETEDMPEEMMQVIMGTVGEGTGREMIEFFNNFKMKDIATKVEAFIKTGKITMPRQTALRLSVVGAVFEAYANGKIDQVKYDSFCTKLSGEERSTITKFEEKYADKLAKKFKNFNRVPTGMTERLLTKSLMIHENTMELDSVEGLKTPGTALILSPDKRYQEAFSFSEIKGNVLAGITRRVNGGDAYSFPAGSTVSQLT